MKQLVLGAVVLAAAACGGDGGPSGSIEQWCALGPTLDEVSAAIGAADFTDPMALEEAMGVLTDSLDDMQRAAPEQIADQVDAFVQGNRDLVGQFEAAGFDSGAVDGAAAARAVESYSIVAVELDTFTAAQCDDPFVLTDDSVEPTAEEATASVSATTELELLDAGATDGRVRLDQPPADGDTWTGEMVVAVDLAVNGEQSDVPSSIVEMEMRVTDVGPDGSFTVRSEVTGVRTFLPDTHDPAVLAEYEPRAATMVGTSTTWTVDPSGNVGDVASVYPDDLDPTLSEGLQIGDRASDQLSVPLPDRPVGVGARWRTDQVTDLEGVQATLVTEYELVEVDDDDFVLATATTQTLSVADGEATGSGTLRQRIGALAPAESSTESDGTYEVEEDDGSVTSLRITTYTNVTETG